MSGVSLPVTRPSGRVLLVGNPAAQTQVAESLQKLGYSCGDADHPYAAMAELCRRPLLYRAVILSLAGLYREELSIIRAIKRRFPHAEVWLAHTDGRQAALADAMRLGADGLLDDDGLHRVAMVQPMNHRPMEYDDSSGYSDSSVAQEVPMQGRESANDSSDEDTSNEPILSADELRALLAEQPSLPPAGDDEH